MDIKLYQQYLKEYIQDAIRESDGSVRGTAERLHEKQVKGLIISHRGEKQRALSDARTAFDDHRHWPMEIILSHLGVTLD